MFTRAIVRAPAPNFSEGLTTVGLGKPDYSRALAQHKAYCAALEKCGLTVIKLETDTRYPDSCFVEDTAVCINAPTDGRATAPQDTAVIGLENANAESAIADAEFSPLRSSASSASSAFNKISCVTMTRPGAPTRHGEVASIREEFKKFFVTEVIQEIQAPGTLDGGDVCDAGNHFFIGLSQRTNEAGAQQLAEILTKWGYTSSVVDIRGVDGLLHFKSGVAYLGDNRLAITQAVMNREAFASYDLIPVPAAEDYAANCVRLNDRVLIAAGYPAFEGQLRDLGYQTIALEMSEFQKMDGGLSCLSLRF